MGLLQQLFHTDHHAVSFDHQLSGQVDFHHQTYKTQLSDQEDFHHNHKNELSDLEVSIDQNDQFTDQVEFTTQTEESKDHQLAIQDSADHESSQSEDHAVADQFDIVDQPDESDDQDVSEDDDQSDIVKLITGHERGRAIRRGKCSSLKLIDLISSVASSQLTNEIRNYLFISFK